MAKFDRISMLVGAGVITVGVSAAALAGAGVAIASTESAAGGQTSMPDSSEPDNEQGRTDGFDIGTHTGDLDGAVGEGDSSADPSGPGEESAEPGTDAAAEVGVAAELDADAEAEAELAGMEADTAPDADSDFEVRQAVARQEPAPEESDPEEPGAGEPGSQAEAGGSDPKSSAQPELISDGEHGAGEPSRPAHPVTESLDPESLVPESLGVTTLPEADGLDGAEPQPEPGGAPEQPVGVVIGDRNPVMALALSARTAAESDVVADSSSVIAPLPMMSAADAPSAEATAPRQTLLSIVGTIIFNLYSFAIRAVSGPPMLPPGSTVTVHSSELDIDCGDGYEVPADWYVPEGETPTQLIYFQHGFLAAAPFYSYSASRLAEATHSIVVAPTVTSNFLACDGCWVGGTQMHEAVANLFAEDNTALAASAAAAGFSPSLLDGLQNVVLAGHSAGGGLAAGAAGYMVDNGTIDRLAGVMMLDGVGFGPVMPEALAKLPDELPVYNLSGKSYVWNMNGATEAALENERPDDFKGVRLVGGLHSDGMLGGNPLIQVALNLATGFSKIENVKAAEIITAAWVNDMFAGSQSSPYYGEVGTILAVETPAGTAEAYVAPGSAKDLTLFDTVLQFLSDAFFGINFATCAVPSAGPSGEVFELSTPNTALSLDGNAKPGHSIGQRVCTG